MTLRTDDALDAALAELSSVEGVSRQEVIRRAILDRQARMRHRARVEESAGRLVDRWGDVLERLGSA